jgi:hypothetical protein
MRRPSRAAFHAIQYKYAMLLQTHAQLNPFCVMRALGSSTHFVCDACAWLGMAPLTCVQVLRVLPHLGTLDGERLKVGGGGVAAFEGAGKLPPPPPLAIFPFLTAHSSGSKSEASFPVPESQAWLTGFKWDDCFDGLLPAASTCVRCGEFDSGAADVDGVMKKHDAEFAKVFARILRQRHTHNRHHKAACLRASLLQPTSAAAA